MNEQSTTIKIFVSGISGETMRDWISASTRDESAIQLKVTTDSSSDPFLTLRGIDPAVLLATLAATGTLLGVLVNAILKFSIEYKRERVTIETRDGRKIEVEAVRALEKVDDLVSQIQQLESTHLTIQVGEESKQACERSE